MRGAWIALAACGSAAPVSPAKPERPIAVKDAPAIVDEDIPGADPIVALGGEPQLVSWIVPKSGQLDPSGASLTVPEGEAPVQVALLEKHGSEIRVGVWLDHVRFALWTDKQWLLATVHHEVRVSTYAGGGDFVDLSQGDPVEAVLRAGAHVRRIAHKDKWTQIRYLGALEIDGWVPDDALVERAPPSDPVGRIPTGRQTLMVVPGAIIYSEPKWGTRELAVMANGYFLDTIKNLDDAWVEVAYADGDIIVHGYYGKHEPPGRTHKPRADENPPPPVVPNQLVASGTCLYAKEHGDPIGFIAGDTQVDLEDDRDGWYALTTDTPWGPITFAVQGPTKQDLTACAPAGSVPPPNPPPP